MGEIVARRLALMVLTMLIVSIAIFLISEVVPIDLARNVLGQFATEESLAGVPRTEWPELPESRALFHLAGR